MQALKARDSRAQGKAAKQPQPWEAEPRQKSPARAAQSVSPLQGYHLYLHLPRVPALRAFSALDTRVTG
jgi:hypothetical protein